MGTTKAAILTPQQRKEIIDSTKAVLVNVVPGTRDEGPLKSTLLSTATMARHMGFTRDEIIGMLRDEWGHMTALDSRTVVKGVK